MAENDRHELAERALAPRASVVIEACAGSGKTWMLVSRIVRLLLAGAVPSQILAITFTRKAAQEMATRLREWLHTLATADEKVAREFLRERAVPENEIESMLPRARLLFEQLLTHQPPITIATFHSWFLQLLRRAPLDAGALGEVNLVEQTSSLVDEAWQLFASGAQRDPGSAVARGLDRLFRDCGLSNTQRILKNFLHRRADWWTYTHGKAASIDYALAQIRADMRVAPDYDVAGSLYADATFCRELADYARLLERNVDKPEQENARFGRLLQACEGGAADESLRIARKALVTDAGEPRKVASKAAVRRLGAERNARFLDLHGRLAARMQEARQDLIDQQSYGYNEAALHCGVALVEAYQRVKQERLVIDYADIEWHAWRLVSVSDHAVYMQYKLDSRYRHILLDEFQDTNPLQWLTLKSWLEAAVGADMRPTVFMVGDPKQSIYRFRRAEARLFNMAGTYLGGEFGADKVPQLETRRCPQPVVDVVNELFGAEADFPGFEEHVVHYKKKPGRVEVLPLVKDEPAPEAGEEAAGELALRNPLEKPLADVEDTRREREAELLVAKIREIRDTWQVADDHEGKKFRRAELRDIMLLVRRRTYLAIYERALRLAGIHFITSRYGGLLDTLEAKDIVALLQFLVSPFEDLKLAHALRTPVFGCTDEDLMALAAAGGKENEGSWWERLQRVCAGGSSASLTRAHLLLARWLERTDSAPVHDQLDRIYFEADVLERYRQAVPEAMRGAVLANLQAFMQRALDTDSGRYPSLPRFLHDLVDLREAPAEEAPDEGIVGDAGNAVRIYTIHGAKGLQSPIVFLLDAASPPDPGRGYDALVDWPPEAPSPNRFSLSSVKAEQSRAQQAIVENENRLAEREELNLLYVAMTRAQQALIVSGSQPKKRETGPWYEKVRAATLAAAGEEDDPGATAVYGNDLTISTPAGGSVARSAGMVGGGEQLPLLLEEGDPRLNAPLPTGERRPAPTGMGLTYGVSFHSLMERLTGGARAERAALQRDLGLSERAFAPMWDQAQRVLAAPALARFFDPAQYRRALNEVSYTTESGEVRRIDRLVEFADEVWVLDYKTGEEAGDPVLAAQYQAQLQDYGAAMQAVYPDRKIRGLIIFSGGHTVES
jgi:ATP-dependent helicase/nuclease subunit A